MTRRVDRVDNYDSKKGQNFYENEKLKTNKREEEKRQEL